MTYNIEDIPDPHVRKKIHKAGPCWLWVGSLNENGYGHFVRTVDGKQKKRYVHRYTYATLAGPIPEGFSVTACHHNRACCNPEHLGLSDPAAS